MMKKLLAAFALAVLTACGGAATDEPATPQLTRLQQAVHDCRPEGGTGQEHVKTYERHVSTADYGNSLSMSSEGNESAGANFVDIVCVLHELEMPTAVASRMDATRALDGMQEATWAGLRAWWTYHPNAGMNIVIEEED